VPTRKKRNPNYSAENADCRTRVEARSEFNWGDHTGKEVANVRFNGVKDGGGAITSENIKESGRLQKRGQKQKKRTDTRKNGRKGGEPGREPVKRKRTWAGETVDGQCRFWHGEGGGGGDFEQKNKQGHSICKGSGVKQNGVIIG